MTVIVRKTIYWLVITASAFPCAAQDLCKTQIDSLNAISDKYAPQRKEIDDESSSIKEDSEKSSIKATFDVKMKDQTWIFDLPIVTMKNRNMSLDLPEVSMNVHAISWDIPTVVMVPRKTGQYPEVSCGGFPPQCTVRWKDIITNIPETQMRRQEIKTSVPEVKMNRTNFVTAVPEFSMSRQQWNVKIPEITLRDIKAESSKLKDRGEKLSDKANQLATNLKTDSSSAAALVYKCYRDDLATKRTEVAAQFDVGIGQISGAIDAIRNAGADPAAVKTDSGTVNLLAQRDTLIQQKETSLQQIDGAIAQLDTEQKTLTTKIIA